MLGLELHFIAMERNQLCNHYSNDFRGIFYYQSHSKEFNITQINVIKM